MSELEDSTAQKLSIRKAALARRKAQDKKDEISRNILTRFRGLDVYQRANTVLFYVGVRSEVRTEFELAWELTESGKRVVVPYCVDRSLELFLLTSMDELETGAFQLPEPKKDLRADGNRRINIAEVDVVMVPGVAFDPHGGRLGNGYGYYDRLLAAASSTTSKVAVAFECQMFARIPIDDHDVRMDLIVTESNIYQQSPEFS